MNPNLVGANRTNVDTAAPSSKQFRTIGKTTKMCLSPAAPPVTTRTLSSAAPSSSAVCNKSVASSSSVDHLRSLPSTSFEFKKKKTSSPTTRKIRRSAKKTTVAVTRRPSDASSMSYRSAASEGGYDTKCGDAVRRLDAEDKQTETIAERMPRRSEEKVHPLYLQRRRGSFTCAPVSFEDGMTLEECDGMYRGNGWERHTRASASSPPIVLDPASSDGEGRVSMLGRLRKLSLGPPRPQRRTNAKSSTDDEEEKTVSTSWSFSSIDSSSSHSFDSSVSSGGGKKTQPRFAVSFSPTVTIHPVPSAALYPQEVFQSIWRGKKEWRIMKRNARREWEFEGENWRSATEEDGFVRDERTERIRMVHPAHVHQAHASEGTGRRRAVRRRAPVANAA